MLTIPLPPAVVLRLQAILAALHDQPLTLPDLLARLEHTYPTPASARRMLRRDLEYLRLLGITVERSHTRPLTYTLRGGAPLLTEADLRALALVRDTFGDRHPQAVAVHALLERLTKHLSNDQRQVYQRRQASHAPVQPAIDYAPYAERIARLEQAISVGELLRLVYRNTRGTLTTHPRIEAHEIEFYERHFYLVAYSQTQRQSYDLRIDRIEQIDPVMRLPPGTMHTLDLITFRYRLAAAVARSGISQRFATQRLVDTLPNGDVIIEAAGRNAFFIVQTLLRYRANAEVLEPDWLREQMVEEAAALARLYTL